MPALFTPLQLDPVALRNRIVISPMCQYSAIEGAANSWHMIHLGHLALSGAALLFIEATAVEPQGRISPNDLGLWNDATQAALRTVIDTVRQHSDIKLGVQLAHAGRKGSRRVPWHGGTQLTSADEQGWQTVAPSAVAYAEQEEPPQALDHAGLARIREAFAASARRAVALGLDVIELHMAHGYLLHQFLSPLANQRDDEYGRDFAGRVRFPLEVFEAVRAVVPAHVSLGVRISATDWVNGGWDVEQSVEFVRLLKQHGCAFVDVSSGGLSPHQQVPVAPGYQVPAAARIKHATGMVTVAIGLITQPQQAEDIIATGDADLVGLARAMLYDPRWPWHAAAALNAQVDAPPQYWRAPPASFKNLFKP